MKNAIKPQEAATELESCGPIDVWVNKAMASVFAPVWEITAGEFARVTEVTSAAGLLAFAATRSRR